MRIINERARKQTLGSMNAGDTFNRRPEDLATSATYIRTDEWPSANGNAVYVVNLDTGALLTLSKQLVVLPVSAEVHLHG